MKKSTVLVVDRDSMLRETMCLMLKAIGHTGLPIPTFANALSALDGVAFDVVLVRIGSRESEESVFLMNAKILQPRLKIIMVTGVKLPPPTSMNIDAVLPIPFGVERLNATVLEVLRSLPSTLTFDH